MKTIIIINLRVYCFLETGLNLVLLLVRVVFELEYLDR